jgi:hypothetical protein
MDHEALLPTLVSEAYTRTKDSDSADRRPANSGG